MKNFACSVSISGGAFLLFASLSAHSHTEDVSPPKSPVDVVFEDGLPVARVNGEVMHIGGGTITSWITVGERGYRRVGLTLSAGALNSQTLPGSSEGIHHDAHLALPRLPLSPFNHSYIAWKPAGHGSDGMYSAPHYDLHFAFVDKSFMQAITTEGDKGQAVPPLGYMPLSAEPAKTPSGSYASVAGQGVHWHYTNAAEWNGGEFEQTFMWGSYDGLNIFMEPMITLDALLHKEEFYEKFELPICNKIKGFYPTGYGWRHVISVSGELSIEVYLDSFEFLKADSPTSCRQKLKQVGEFQ